LPPVIGHRGAAASAPENTLASFRRAHELGARWVEFDVRLTHDGALVVLHDARLDRTTDGRGRVAALSLAAIGRADAGGWFAAEFAGERVPTLEAALDLAAELGLGTNIEIKSERGRERATAAAVVAILARRGGSSNGAAEPPPVLLSSFRPVALAAAHDLAPEIPRGLLVGAVPRNWRALAQRLGCATIHADHRRLSAATVAAIREAGYPVLAYTVGDAERARTLFDWGVTSVFADAPNILDVKTADHRIPGQVRQGAVS
jgi:glycerophosphoryl diester phosphodiesterase